MLKKSSCYKDFPEEFHQQAYYIAQLMKLIDDIHRRGPQGRGGCRPSYFKVNQRCYIYWPRVQFQCSTSKNFLGRITGYPKTYEPTRAYQRDLKQHVEGLLGPLLLPVTDDYFEFANKQPCSRDSGEYLALVDADNYTAFQYLKPDSFHGIRPQIFPPMDPEILSWLGEVPEPLQLLYHAWVTLRLRCVDNLFSFEDKGVGYTNKGFLFIHWERFMRTISMKWKRAPLSNQEIHDALRYAKEPKRISHHMLLKDLRVKHGHSLSEAVAKASVRNPYLQTLYEMGMGTNVASFNEYCTIVDPIGLYRRKNLFDGRFYSRQRKRHKESLAESSLRRKQGLPPKRTEKLYSFEFSPSQFLKEPLDVTDKLPDYQWFDNHHSETIYAIKRKDVFYFSRPNHLTTARDAACSADVQVWLRALDSLKMLMEVSETGEWDLSAKSVAIPRSDYLKALTEELRGEAGRAFIVDFANRMDTTSPIGKPVSGREFDRAVQMYMAKKQRDESFFPAATMCSGNWYNKLVAKVAKEKIDPSSVRREAYVHPPGYESPLHVQFYAPMAVRTFEQFAKASFGITEFKYQQTPLCPLLTDSICPAPYVLAWARFCIRIAEDHYNTAPQYERQGSNWTPEEDIILATNYHTHRHFTEDQWRDLLAQLPLRSKTTCCTRVILNNRLLKTLLTPQRLEIHRFGRRACTFTQAKRTIFLLGCARAELRLKKDINKASPFIKKVFAISDQQIDTLPIPVSYNANHFAYLLDPY